MRSIVLFVFAGSALAAGPATFLGGSLQEAAEKLVLAPDGDVVVAGRTSSTDFPGVDPMEAGPYRERVFVSRLSGDLTQLRWSVVFPDDLYLTVGALAADAEGNFYLAGETASANLPTAPDAFQPAVAGQGTTDAFVMKLDPQGAVLWATYFGGAGSETLGDLAVDGEGRAHLVGSSDSQDLPVTADAFDAENTRNICEQSCYFNFLGFSGCNDLVCRDAFFAVLGPDGDRLDYATYLGADPPAGETAALSFTTITELAKGNDDATAIELAEDGGVWIGGRTETPGFPGGAEQEPLVPLGDDAFVTRLRPDFSLAFSTLVGGDGDESVVALGGDGGDGVFVAAASYRNVNSGSSYTGLASHLTAEGETERTIPLGVLPTDAAVDAEGRFSVLAWRQPIQIVITNGESMPQSSQSCLAPQSLLVTLAEDGVVEQPLPLDARALGLDADGRAVVGGAGTILFAGAPSNAFQPLPAERTRDALILSRDRFAPAAPRVDCSLNTASRQDGFRPYVSPGEIVSFVGGGLGPDGGVVPQPENNRFPTQAGGVRVLFDGVEAPLLWVSGSEVNVVAPFDLDPGEFTTVRFERDGIEADPFSLYVSEARPGVFSENFSGRGQGVIFNQDGASNAYSNPAAPGSTVTFFATGLGPVNLQPAPGSISGDTEEAIRPLLPIRLTIGGKDAEILELRPAPGLVAGAWQIRARVPGDLAADSGHWLQIYVRAREGEQASQTPLTIAVSEQ
ncbi:MAG: hypothetical protein GC160_18930 [Acidobacteria bacterium]|nr:hypothetical protein [Acidobacteriota bacterium]